jgi:DNA-binding response OmpR family regulator
MDQKPQKNPVPPRILVVEDDVALGRSLLRMVRSLGYEAQCVETVARALAALERSDVVILDLNLPDGCGTEILSRIRADRLPHKVVVLTASTDAGTLTEVARLQPDGVLHKPEGILQLNAWLSAHLNPERGD